MSIDWSLNLGHLLTIFGFVIGGLTFAMTIRGDVTSLKVTEENNKAALATRLEVVERDMRRITEVLVELAAQDERLNSHSQRFAGLEQRLATAEHSISELQLNRG